MKKLLILATLLCLCSPAWAVNKYARTVGGNWTDNATWSTTSGGAADTVAPTASDDVFLDANSGNVTISATSVAKSVTCTGYTGTLTHGNFSLSVSGSVTLVSGMTYTNNGTSNGTIVFAATGTLTTGGKLLYKVTTNSGVALTLGDNLSFVDNVSSTITHQSSTALNMNGKTISGFSATSRVFINSGTIGTSKTLTLGGGTFANADFRDITFSSASDVDLSAITGLSGDAGGNSITGGGSTLTFTPSATQTYTGGTGNWSDVTKWTSRVPLPQDDVNITGQTGSYTITADMPRLGRSIDWSGALGTPTMTLSGNTMYGSINLTNLSTMNGAGLTIENRTTATITSGGTTFAGSTLTFTAGGSYSLQDAIVHTGTSGFRVEGASTITTNDYSVTAYWYSYGTTSATTHNLGSSTLTSFGLSGNVFAFPSAATINAGTSTLFISDTGASGKTIIGGGHTLNNILIAGGGSGAITITGANTFNRIYTDGGGTKSIVLPGSTTTTILSNQGLNNGTNLITFTASAGSATIENAQGNLSWDYVSLTNIPGSTAGNGKFYAGTHSTDGGGNTNWVFSNVPNDSRRRGNFIGYPGVYKS